MAPTRRNSACSRVETGLKGVLAGAPKERSQAERPSVGTIVGKASAAAAQFCRSVRRGCEDATQARDQVRLRQKDLAKRPPWGSGLTPGKQQQRTPLRVAPPSRHNKTTLASHSHWTPAAETPAEAALPTNRTLSFAPAPAMAQDSQLGEASTVQGPMTNGSAGATQGGDAVSTLHHGGQGVAATKGTKKQMGGAPVVGKVQSAQLDPSEALAAFLDPPSPRSPLDFAKPQSFLSSTLATASKFNATAQQTGAHSEAADKFCAPLEARLTQAQAERAALQAAVEMAERALEKELCAGVAQEQGFSRALQGSVKTAKAFQQSFVNAAWKQFLMQAEEARRSLAARTAELEAAQAAAVDESKRRVDAENRTTYEAAQRVEAEAHALSARQALESARAELTFAAAGKEEAEVRADTEALKRQQAELQLDLKAGECAALSASLTEERAARSAAAEEGDRERTRGREDADVALRASAETIARLEAELDRAQSGAAAAARELEDKTAKLEAEAAKAEALASRLEQAQIAGRQTIDDAVGTALKERASARALVAEAEARLAAVDKKAAGAEQQAAEARALADSEKGRAEALEEELEQDRAQWKAAESAAESQLRAANARAKDAELKLEETRKQLAQQVTCADQSVAASTARVGELEAVLRRAQAAHVALETEHETAAARVAHLQEVNGELEAEVSEKSADIQGLVAEMSQLTDESLAEERKLKGEVARARAEREKDSQAAQAEIAKLKRALSTAQAALKKAPTQSAKPTEDLERENAKLKQENTELRTAADVAATAEAADRRAFKTHLETEREHGETLIEQLRVKNEEVDSLEAEVLFLKQQQNETSNYRELRAYTLLHELGGKVNETRHKLARLLVSFQEPGPSSAHPLAFIQDELARLRAFLDAAHVEDMDVAGPSSSKSPASPQQGAPDKSVNDTEVGDCGLTGWGEVDDAVVLVDTGSDAVDAA